VKLDQNLKDILSGDPPNLGDPILTQLKTNGDNNLKNNIRGIQLYQLSNLLSNQLPIPPFELIILDLKIQMDKIFPDTGLEDADQVDHGEQERTDKALAVGHE
jgi:hypothetical protein